MADGASNWSTAAAILCYQARSMSAARDRLPARYQGGNPGSGVGSDMAVACATMCGGAPVKGERQEGNKSRYATLTFGALKLPEIPNFQKFRIILSLNFPDLTRALEPWGFPIG